MIGSGIELTPEHPIDRLVELATAAEASGVDAVLVSSHYNNRDPFIVLDRIARSTDRIRLGPGVVNPYETHPVALASRVATLHESSGGRTIYGIGAGDRSTLANLGIDHDRPLGRVLATIETTRALFEGERVSREEPFVATDAGLNYTVSGLSDVPIYVGAQGPRMLGMAGKHADGVLVNASHPADLDWAVARINRGEAQRPDGLPPLDVVAFASLSVAHEESAAREAARPPVAYIVAGARDAVLDRHDIDGALASSIGESISRGDFSEAFATVTPAMIDAFCIAGDPDTVEDRLRSLYARVDGVVAGSPLGPDIEDAVSLAGAAVTRARERASR